MLQNAYLLATIGADTAENEHHFAEFLPIGRRVTGVAGFRRAHVVSARRARVPAEERGQEKQKRGLKLRC